MIQWIDLWSLVQPECSSSISRPVLSDEPNVASDCRPGKDVKDLSSEVFETIMHFLGEHVEDTESPRVTTYLLNAHLFGTVMDVQRCSHLFEPSAAPSICFSHHF